MKKLRLDVDALQVESFDPTATEAPPRGTVEGNLIAEDPYSLAQSGCEIYSGCCPTLAGTCYNTCKASCNGTCMGQATCFYTCRATCICPSHHNTECNCISMDYTACCV
jgi:modification target Cys-rich repeat protein